ncbi:DUF3784 domain-containing protein [Lysinibacillus sp. 3P01SB]|uniref:DUF3784 domain-containing protein n=1 Tax=Lysinibacillus sp. 3P01SB TaxID=3132284 RepID=UPI0039A478A0
MKINLMIIGLLLLAIGYFVGVKKMTWLLSGFNERRVKDKEKLANLVGGAQILLGAMLIIGGLVGVHPEEYLIIASVVILLGLLVYVNYKMVE